ncbi:MAG: EutN/CcmL family microcompartment protein [Anaerolineales bacterium]
MIIGKVIGTVVTTISHPNFQGRRMLVVQPLDPEGEEQETLIALDITHAGIGDTVLVNDEGNGARQILDQPEGCVRSVIVGIIDTIHMYE